MFPSEFEYYRASSIAEAGELLGKHPGAKLLAGGHSLIPVLKLRLAAPTALIDIGRIADLRSIRMNSNKVSIGALTTHADLASSGILQEYATALSEAAGMIGDPAVRNRGTIGGNVAHADPASDLPPVLSCLGAQFTITDSSGVRKVAADDFFQGLMTTALGENDVLVSLELSAAESNEGSAYVKFAHPASRYAVIGVASRLVISNGKCTTASVVLGGLTPVPVRAQAVEDTLVGKELTSDAIHEASSNVGDCLIENELLGDIYASAEYRKSVAHVWVRRALETAFSRAC